MELWDHICKSITWLVEQQCFKDRLAYASDVSSFERWLQFELAYAISRELYAGIDPNAPWVKPEYEVMDIPVVQGAGSKPWIIGHGELKVIFNNKANTKRALGGIHDDWGKLSVTSEKEPLRFLLVGLVNLKYPHDGRFKYNRVAMPESLDMMENQVVGVYTSAGSVAPVRWDILNLNNPEGGREKGEFRLILLKRETAS